MNRRRQRLLEFRHQRLDIVYDGDRIGAWRLLDRDALRSLVAKPRTHALVLYRIDSVPDILDAHRRAVFVGDDDVAVAFGVEQLVVGIQRDRLMLGLDLALWVVYGGGDKRIADILHAQALCGERRRVDLDAGGVRHRTEHKDLPDPGLGREPFRDDIVGVLVDDVWRQRVGVNGIDQDGEVCRVYLAIGRRSRHVLRQQPAGRIDRLLHVLRRRIDIARQIELQRDRGDADAAK